MRWVAVDVELPEPGRVRPLRVEGLELVVCNVGGVPYALADRCPHFEVPLSGGALHGFELECPVHGGKVDVRDGSPAQRPIRSPARTFPVRTGHSGLEIGLPE